METNSAGLNATPNDNGAKRKRSPENDGHAAPAAPPKTAKTTNTTNVHLAINYLARQYSEDLPLISNEDSLPQIIALLQEYHGVLERHESMACNLGARPLGPILMKRFERLFDGPPKVLKNHGKDGNIVTWLDVVEFARNKPEQFTLDQRSEGLQVCQFYTKQCRVQISEEDYLLISSGIPQKLIPPQPIVEDEEKELGTLEILEKNLSSICHAADQVAARTRQLRHRISGRKQAILERRANEPGSLVRGTSPSLLNGVHASFQPPHVHSQIGFVAVNASHGSDGNGAEFSKTGASSTTRHELMSKFMTHDQKTRRDAGRAGFLNGGARRSSSSAQATPSQVPSYHRVSGAPVAPLPDIHPRLEHHDSSNQHASGLLHSHPPHPDRIAQGQDHSPANSQAYPTNPSISSSGTSVTPAAKEKELDGPFKAEMIARMETLKRGDRVMPPCDRCRRLHMDCVKNLTACQGCTKKHAKCSWRDVRESEVFGPDANKVPIPATEVEREREPSVGYRPEDKEVGTSHSPLSTTPSNGAFSGTDIPISARIMAMGGMLAQGNASLNSTPDSEYQSPVQQYPSSQQQPSLPPLNQQLESARHDSGPSPRIEYLRMSTEEGTSHVDRPAAPTTTTANRPESGYGERREGHQSMVV